MKKITNTRVKKALKYLKSQISVYRIIDWFEMNDFVEFECDRCDEVILYRVYDTSREMHLVIVWIAYKEEL